jgi:hypothetical protein
MTLRYLNTADRRHNIKTLELSVHRYKTIPQLAAKYAVSENTIRSDLHWLSEIGAAHFQDGKPQRWFACTVNALEGIDPELAYAVNVVLPVIKSQLPATVFERLQTHFDCANDAFYKVKRNNSQDNIVQYERKVRGINILEHITRGNITEGIVEVIKEVIFVNQDVEVRLQNESIHSLSDITLQEINGSLNIKGTDNETGNKSICFNSKDILAIEAKEYLSFRGPRK